MTGTADSAFQTMAAKNPGGETHEGIKRAVRER